MLKKCLFNIILLLTSYAAQAQYYDSALGLRAGTSFQASYKRFLFYDPTHIQQSIEGLFGVQLDLINKQKNGYVLEALYNFHMDLGFDTGFSGYAGAGLFGGIYTQVGLDNRFGGGITATVGVEYTFKLVPINISIDWRPFLGIPRSSLIGSGITVRYVFPTTWQ
jgi:hypothetical protein